MRNRGCDLEGSHAAPEPGTLVRYNGTPERQTLSGGYMKRLLLWTVLCLALPGALRAQNESVTDKSDRMFFPHDTLLRLCPV